ncbi:glycoside hydrolase family 16 protein [Gemmatimonas phototrophica]|uniref:glycoside hydrolase family 16 protein n=1 Tax=Gemmatimonas phototrophica TaxID=1379270 RepID=UPI0006A6D8BF|nr:glycoside hydrolase family 16 protein [Gemmatimonas phototrophica]
MRAQRRSRRDNRRGELRLIAACFWVGTLISACSETASRTADSSTATTALADTLSGGWRLTWRDEFDGTSLDSSKWVAEQGNGFWNADSSAYVGGWGNEELQCYTANAANVQLRDGALQITALRETVRDASSRDPNATCHFTSARLKTRAQDGRALFAQQYGRVVFRARLPEGQGLWPALWMLPLRDTYGTWAASGEIDILEARGQNPHVVLGTLHYGGQWPGNVHTGMDYVLPDSGRISDWHEYAVEWTPGRITWSVDDSTYQTQTQWYSGIDSTQKAKGAAPFDQPFYLVMNLAVGGRFLGPPDSRTTFPGRLEVDWVRVYQRAREP